MNTLFICLAATFSLFAAGMATAATPDRPLEENAFSATSSPEPWLLDGGEARMRFNDSFLELFEIGAELSSGVVDTANPEYAVFPVISSSGLRINAPEGSFDRFVDGGLTLRGGFELILPDGSQIDLRDATLRPNPDNGARLDLIGRDGKAWLFVDHLMYEFVQDYRVFSVRSADIRSSRLLAKRIGEPALIDAYVGEINLTTTVMERSKSFSPQAPTGGPNFHGTTHPQGGTFVADVLMDSFSMSFSRCRRESGANGCDGAGPDNGEVVFTPSATLRNSNTDRTADVPWYRKFTTSPYSYPYQGNDQHPYLVWNMYRIVDDQLEQIGASGIKHAFLTINVGCAPGGNQFGGHILGRHCSDTYGTGNNDSNSDLGPRIELLPASGEWGRCGSVYDPGCSGSNTNPSPNSNYGSRLVVRESQMLVPGATYWSEAWYIVQDDTNIYNTMARRPMSPTPGNGFWVPGSQGSLNGCVNAPFVGCGPVLNAWVDPVANPARNVELDSREHGRARVAVKVRELANCPAASGLTGTCYRYDYAAQNFDFATSQTSGTPPNFSVVGALGFQRFSLSVASGTQIWLPTLPISTDFADIDIDAGNNWTGSVGPTSVSWQAPAGNTLNWGTLFRFSFVSTSPPGEDPESVVSLVPADTGVGATTLMSNIVGPSGNAFEVMHDGFEGQ